MEFTVKIEFPDAPHTEKRFEALTENSVYYDELITDLIVAIKGVVVEFLQRSISRTDVEVDVW